MKRKRTLKTFIAAGLAAAGFAGLGAGNEAEAQVAHRVSDATYEKDPSVKHTVRNPAASNPVLYNATKARGTLGGGNPLAARDFK